MFNPSRLELARKRRRLTSTTLASRAKISLTTLSRIVNGHQTSYDETIGRIVAALDYPQDFFFGEDIDVIDVSSASFRSLKAMTARERDAAVAAGSLAYLLNDWVKAEFDLPPVDLPNLGYENSPEAAARMLRQHWSLGEKPIGNIIKLFEAKGIRVFSLAENTRNVDAFSCWRGDEPFVFLNTIKSAERTRFDAAHELGHLILHRHGGPKQGKNAETDANSFAREFLMPHADVVSTIAYVTELRDIIMAKKRWRVSALALTFHLHKLKLISDWQYRTFCIQLNRTYGHNEPEGIAVEYSGVWMMVLTELWKEGVSRNHIAAILKIPLDEMGNLLFGLMCEIDAPPRSARPPVLRAI